MSPPWPCKNFHFVHQSENRVWKLWWSFLYPHWYDISATKISQIVPSELFKVNHWVTREDKELPGQLKLVWSVKSVFQVCSLPRWLDAMLSQSDHFFWVEVTRSQIPKTAEWANDMHQNQVLFNSHQSGQNWVDFNDFQLQISPLESAFVHFVKANNKK